ncbi:SDR family NAD(P)-dependent oxidoreductase [Serratia ureilytica]|uniref:SDR family NAD(P)-dependent oxidoreductase n=1 Tax=Serratia ureilytica TaxID=300181 RepID=UPI001D1838FB|nr:SDR family NAD(P)-dependent oxidoreductase [Serratia ureilytica]MCC4106273.1 SDR family NAD(P)-dependent oxidoreductase [Serratia ureilytica]
MKLNKYAVITGASSGIGYALCRQALLRGYIPIMVANDEAKLAVAAQQLSQGAGADIITLPCNLADMDSLDDLMSRLMPYIESIEVFINNAGIGQAGEFVNFSLDEHRNMLAININALVTLSHFITRHFIQKKRGYLMNVASLAAFQPGPYYAGYYATKSYILHFTEGLAVEMARHNVVCSALCPGTTRTLFHQRAGSTETGLANGLFGIVMSADNVARVGFAGLLKRRAVIVPGIVNTLAMWSVRCGPRWLVRRITASINQ